MFVRRSRAAVQSRQSLGRRTRLPIERPCFLVQQVGGTHTLNMRSQELAELARISRDGQRQTVFAILGVGLLVAAAVLYAMEAEGPRLLGLHAAVSIACLGALWAFLAAWPRRN